MSIKTKQVSYFGSIIDVPMWTNYMAANDKGTIFAFSNPAFSTHHGWSSSGLVEEIKGYKLSIISPKNYNDEYNFINTLQDVMIQISVIQQEV